MRGKRKGSRLAGALTALLGFVCALILGSLFYGTMVYQLAGEQGGGGRTAARAQASPAPLDGEAAAASLFPGAVLALDPAAAQETGATAQDVSMGGAVCRVVVRSYTLADGSQARALSATPAAYLERLTGEGVQMQLITGFVLAGMDAVYAVEGGTGILAARDGDFIYMLEAQADEQTLYALGTAAGLTAQGG